MLLPHSRFVLTIATTVLAICPLTANAASSISEADYVAYAKAPVSGSFRFVLDCTAKEGQFITDDVIASAVDSGSEQMYAKLSVNSRTSHGYWLQVAGYDEEFEPREEVHDRSDTAFRHWGGMSVGPGNYSAWIAWAIWGTEPTCTLRIDGSEAEVHVAPTATAVYVHPGSFEGGVFYQKNARQVAAARVLSHDGMGGPLFAALSIGETGAGLMTASTPSGEVADYCERPNGHSCNSFGVRHGLAVSVADLIGVDDSGSGESQFWMIALPGDA